MDEKTPAKQPVKPPVKKELDVYTLTQQKTFIGWMNWYLKDRMLHVSNLDSDISDGVTLINLVEILTKTTLSKYTKGPKTLMHKIQNNNIALQAISTAGVISSGCSAEDLTNGNLKMILGLLWTLILHFQILEDSSEEDKKKGAKESLLKWVKDYLKEYKIDFKEFPKIISDGKLLAYLIHKRDPTLIDLAKIEEKTNVERLKETIDLAERALSVPRLVDAQDIAEDKVDEKSLLCYLSYFRSNLSKPINGLLSDAKVQAEMDELRKQLEEEAHTSRKKLDEMEKMQLQLAKATKEKELEQLRQRELFSGLESEVKELKELKNIVSIQNDQAFVELKEKYKESKKKYQTLKQHTEQVEFELEEVWKKLKDEKKLKETAQQGKKVIEEELESLRTKIKAEIAKATSLQSQLEKAGEEGRALQDKLVSEKEKRKELEFESEKRMREFEKQLIQSGTAGLKEELQRQLMSMQEDMREFKSRVSDLEREREKLRNTLHETESVRDEYQRQNLSLKMQTEKLTAELQETRAKLEERAAKTKQAVADKKKIEEELDSLQRKYRIQLKASADQDEQKKILENQLNELRSKLKASGREKDELQEKNDSISFELQKLQSKISEIDALKKKIKEEKEKRKRLEDEYDKEMNGMRQKLLSYDKQSDAPVQRSLANDKELEERKRKFEEEMKEMRKKMEDREKHYEEVEQNIKDLNLALENKVQQLLHTEHRTEELSKENSQLISELENLKKQSERAKAVLIEKETMDAEFSSVKAELEDKREKLNSLKEEKQKLEEDIRSLKANSITSEDATAFTEKINILTIELQKVKESNQDLQNLSSDLERKEKKRKEEVDQLLEEISSYKKAIYSLQQVAESSDKESALKMEMEKLKQEKAVMNVQIKDLESELTHVKSTRDELKQRNTLLVEEINSTKKSVENSRRSQENLQDEVSKLRQQQQLLIIQKEQMKERENMHKELVRTASTESQNSPKMGDRSKVKEVLEEVHNEFLKWKTQLESAREYNDAIKISKRIRDAKKQLEGFIAEIQKEENESKRYIQMYPRKVSAPPSSPPKEHFASREVYQKVKKLREVVCFAIEKALDDVHYLKIKVSERQTREILQEISNAAKALMMTLTEPVKPHELISPRSNSSSSIPKVEVAPKNTQVIRIEKERDEAKEILKKIRAKVDLISMEKAVELARSIRQIKKDLQDFFTANNIAIPADSNPISVQGDDKFTALKNMMFSTLNRINSQVGVLAQEAVKSENEQKANILLEKITLVKKSFEV